MNSDMRPRAGGQVCPVIGIAAAGHGFEGANLERASAATVQWFEQVSWERGEVEPRRL